MSPFTPFLTEYMYTNLSRALPEGHPDKAESVHYLELPETLVSSVDTNILRQVKNMQDVIVMGRSIREKVKIFNKQPLREIIIVHHDDTFIADVESLAGYITSELTVKTITVTKEEGKYVSLQAVPDNRALGRRLGKAFRKVGKAIRELTPELVCKLRDEGSLEIEGENVSQDEVELVRQFNGDAKKFSSLTQGPLLVILNIEKDEKLMEEATVREVMNRIQRLRKKAEVKPTDSINIYFKADKALTGVITRNLEEIVATIGMPVIDDQNTRDGKDHTSEETDVDGAKLALTITML